MENKRKSFLLSVGFWFIIWLILSSIINNEIVLPTPLAVCSRLLKLFADKGTYLVILKLLKDLSIAFAISLLLALILSYFAYRFSLLKDILIIPMSIMKSVPVVSIIMIILIWLDSSKISLIIAVIMGLPIFYSNLMSAYESIDQKLLEMARVFRLKEKKKIRYFYPSQVKDYLASASLLASSMMIKAIIAAEVLSLPKISFGDRLYKAKLYLDMTDLLAWTLIILAISIAIEKLVGKIVRRKPC